MLYMTCTMLSGIDLAHYAVSRAKDWVSVDYGTRLITGMIWFCHVFMLGLQTPVRKSNYCQQNQVINRIALRKAKIAYNFGLSECNRVKSTLSSCFMVLSC